MEQSTATQPGAPHAATDEGDEARDGRPWDGAQEHAGEDRGDDALTAGAPETSEVPASASAAEPVAGAGRGDPARGESASDVPEPSPDTPLAFAPSTEPPPADGVEAGGPSLDDAQASVAPEVAATAALLAGVEPPASRGPDSQPLPEVDESVIVGPPDEIPAPRPGPHEARIIALANQKGGVGKTTTTINLGAALAERGERVLLIDFDPQGGCALGLGIEPGSLDLSVYDALLDRNCRVEDAILTTSFPNLELLPSNIDLAAAELMLVQEVAREQTLMRVLAPLRMHYNFILIDCQPSLGLLTINALTAADGVIVPLECEYYALRGMALLMDSIEKIKERLNPSLHMDGILATMLDSRTLHSREVMQRVREAFGEALFDTVIRKTIRFAEAPVAGEPILSYAPLSAGASAYRRLAQEVMDRVATRQSARS